VLKVMKMPTQKGEHSCKCTELSLKQRRNSYTWASMWWGLLLEYLRYILSWLLPRFQSL